MYTVELTTKEGDIRKLTVQKLIDATRIVQVAVNSGNYLKGEITKAEQKLN